MKKIIYGILAILLVIVVGFIFLSVYKGSESSGNQKPKTEIIVNVKSLDDGGDVAREKLVIDSDCRGKSDDLLRNDSAADDRLDGAGGVKRSGRHRGDLCAQTVALRGGAGPGIVKAVVGFAVERGCSTALGLGDTKARCVQRKRNLGAPINGSRSGCANRCFAGYGIAIRRRVRPCRHDDEAQDQCQSQ